MYLHTLRFQAIGPFAGEHHIDVSRLSASGLFLLDGPTGAGKSTIIDMVTFALYGKVASEAASEDRLRSAFASPQVESFVDLVLETSAGIFRIRRTPEFTRPKKRGTGTTTQQASVLLWRLPRLPELTEEDGIEGELLSSRLDEAGGEIRRIIGLDRTQFVQTVVLPQGEFSRFLRADPEDRGKLLQKVFGTELYDRIAGRLADQRKAAARRVDESRAAVAGAVEHFIGASAPGEERSAELHDALATLAEQSDRVHSVAVSHLAELEADTGDVAAREAAAVQALAAARTRVADAERLVAGLRRRDELHRSSAELAERAESIAGARKRLQAGVRAAGVAPLVAGAQAAAADAQAAATHCAQVRAHLPAEVADAGPQAWEIWQAQLAAVSVRLVRLAEIGADLPVRCQEIADGRTELHRLTQERDHAVADLAERPAARAELDTALRSWSESAAGGLVAGERLLRAREVEQAAQAAAVLAAKLATAVESHAEAVRAAEEAIQREAQFRSARIAGIAGELAESLTAGDPCPVCGSPRHPAPAPREARAVGAAEVEAAERHRATAESLVWDAGQQVASLTARLSAEQRVAGEVSIEEATLAVVDAEAAVRESEHASQERDRIAADLVAFDARTAQIQESVGVVAHQVTTRTAELDEAERAVGVVQEEIAREIEAARPLLGTDLDAEHGDPVAALRVAVDERSVALAALVAADSAASAAREAAATRAQDVTAAARQHGFDDVDAAVEAVLTEDDRDRLDREVASYDAAREAVRVGLAELADLPLVAVEEAEVEAIAAAEEMAEVEAIAQQVTRLHGFAAQTLQAARTAADGIHHAVAGWLAARTEAAPVVRMANLAAGLGSDNPQSLSLATFVLMRRFEDVMAAANDRLVEMSCGRYELASSEVREDVRARRTGLAMRVIDHVSGQSRDPRTLSGGETFYVSLCLALGLADVVTAEAGGVELGTLFVDEGFGSLDPGTLDAVLAELGRLRAGGRVVGVVSHVEALKQSIAERIEVRPVPGGGSTLTVRA